MGPSWKAGEHHAALVCMTKQSNPKLAQLLFIYHDPVKSNLFYVQMSFQ